MVSCRRALVVHHWWGDRRERWHGPSDASAGI